MAGEGEAAIAARAGISIAQLEALNPGHMSFRNLVCKFLVMSLRQDRSDNENNSDCD